MFRAISDAWDDFLDNNAEITWGCTQFSQSCRDNAAAIIRDKVDACVLSVQTNYGRLWFRWLDVKSILYSASGLIRPAMFSCVWFGLVSSLLGLFSRHSVTVPECIDVANKPERGFGGSTPDFPCCTYCGPYLVERPLLRSDGATCYVLLQVPNRCKCCAKTFGSRAIRFAEANAVTTQRRCA